MAIAFAIGSNRRRDFRRLADCDEPFVVCDGLIRVESYFFSVCANESAVENSPRQEVEFFIFNGDKEARADTGFGRNPVQ